MKPFAESSEQNKLPILEVLKHYLPDAQRVLEIGSGTGQHAVFFSKEFPNLHWHASDREENHPGILAWLQEAKLENLYGPKLLDVNQADWPNQEYDAVFSANTAHIMNWHSVKNMFRGVGQILKPGGVFCLYGPFNYNGHYTSDSNARFDVWLKERDLESAIRDFEALCGLADENGMTLLADHEMPANNRILVWTKSSPD
jgi:cyclopropane fatty-acyl-phospholipid synthase-like methyltransferase